MPNLPFCSKKQEGFTGGKTSDVQRNALLAEEFERRTPQQNAIGQSFPSGNYERHRPARADWSDTWEGSANSSHSDVIKQHRARDAEFQRRYREAMAPKAGPAGSMAGLAGSKAGPARSNPQLPRTSTERPRSGSLAGSGKYGSGSGSVSSLLHSPMGSQQSLHSRGRQSYTREDQAGSRQPSAASRTGSARQSSRLRSSHDSENREYT
ncbi:hypothetical protein LTR29_007682 [Friedmanniomyces endolithicus]|nr:hypothetical protein LTR29_007682 [Friedmanniomyces endolithicus]